MNWGTDVKDQVVAKNAKQQSQQTLSGQQESNGNKSVENPWSGRLRTSPASSSNVSQNGKEKVDDAPYMPHLSASHHDGDGDSSGFEQSLDDEFGIPAVKTLGVRKSQATGRVPRSDPGPRRSRRHRALVQRLTYDSYVACHCAYMAKIVQDVEPKCFDEAVGNVEWEHAMNEEMAACWM